MFLLIESLQFKTEQNIICQFMLTEYVKFLSFVLYRRAALPYGITYIAILET